MSQLTTFLTPHASVHDRWLGFRDHLLSSPRFLRFARSFPLTRAIARRRARTLFDLCAGFVYAQVLQACVELNLFARLAEGPRSVGDLSIELGLSAEATEQLLQAAVSLDLVEDRGRRGFGLGVLGAAMLANPGVAAMVEHHALFYRDLQDPVGLLRGEIKDAALSRYWSYTNHASPGDLTNAQVASYSALMAASVSLVADEVVDAYPIEQYRCLLDVGGGEGGFLAAAAQRAPKLKLMLFDLPPVAERARSRLAAAGLSDRSTIVGGNFLSDPLPQGADIASLVRVIHDHDDDTALAILRAVRRALPSNGILLLAEPMSGTPGAESVGYAYFALYLRAMGRGRARTCNQLTALLRAAGFPYVKLVPTRLPLQTQLLMASPKG